MFKRILCALIAGLMLVPLAACSDNKSKDNDQNPSGNPDESTNEEGRQYLDDLPETMDFADRDIRFAVEEGANGNLTELSIWVEEDSADIVEAAVYNRNLILNERLNINIVLTECLSMNEVAPLIRTSVTGGSNDYDVVGLYQYFGAKFASEGMLYNLNNLQYNDFSREYWGTQYIDAMSYKGRTYWATGDMSLRYTGGMYVTYVNDTIWNNNFPGQSVYAMVDEGTWTLDKMYDITSTVYTDVNANGEADKEDTYGLALELNDLIDGMCAGILVPFGAVDEEGNPYVALSDERTYSAYDKLYKLTHNNPGFLNTATDDSIYLMTKFNDSKYMMVVNKLYQSAIYLREMEDDFKIIPIPKFDEEQEKYNTRIHDSVTIFGVPITAVNEPEQVDAISATLEAMASESYRLVSPAYYETALKVKFTRDSDSGRMIDLISQNVSTDFITLYSNALGDVNHFFRNNLASDTESISSQIRVNKRVWEKSVQKFLTAFDKIAEAE